MLFLIDNYGELASRFSGRLGECFHFNRLWPWADESDVSIRRNTYFYRLRDFTEVFSSLKREFMEVTKRNVPAHRYLYFVLPTISDFHFLRNYSASQAYFKFIFECMSEVVSSGCTRKCQYFTLIR